MATLILTAIISLLGSEWSSIHYPTFAFYLLPTRGWEILLGVFVAVYLANKKDNKTHSIKSRQILSASGLLLIVFPIYLFNEQTPYPSLYTLIPTAGAALILLFATSNTLTKKILSNRFLVSIGLISYSAYLWHQPLFAFARLRLGSVSQITYIALIGTTLLFSYLSWQCIEKPFRDKNYFSQKKILLFWILGSLLFIIVGFFGYLTNGFEKNYKEKLTEEQKEIYSFLNFKPTFEFRTGKCLMLQGQSYQTFSPECKLVDKNKPAIFIWGDSHAAALSFGLRKIYKNVIQYTASSCPPILNTIFTQRPDCFAINDFIKDQIKDIKPSVILLHASWPDYVFSFKNIKITIDIIHKISPTSRIIIIGPVPHYLPTLPEMSLRHNMHLSKMEERLTPSLYAKVLLIDKELQKIAKNENIFFFSPIKSLCINKKCRVVTNISGKVAPMAYDSAHLTEDGSLLLAKKLLEHERLETIKN